MTELNTQIELIVSEIIGATRKAKTLEDLGQANTNGINDITKLVKNLSLSGVSNYVKIAMLKQLEELSDHIPAEIYTRKVIEIQKQFL